METSRGRFVEMGETTGKFHTTSPKNSTKRCNSTENIPIKQKGNYHLRNIELLKSLAQRNSEKLKKQEEEKQKLEETRQRLAKIVRKRAKQAKLAKETTEPQEPQEKLQETQEEPPEDSQKKQLSSYFRSRYHTLLKAIQENNRTKQQQKENEEKKKAIKEKKLKDELGLNNVSSKLYAPTVSSLVYSQSPPEEVAQLKGIKYNSELPPKPKPKPETEETKTNKKEAAEKIVRRAQEHIMKLAQKKAEEAKREAEAKEREAKLKAALRETVLNTIKQTEPKPEEPKTEELEEETKVKVRKPDEKVLQRLTQSKKPNSYTISDMAKFKKRHKLEEDTKVFVCTSSRKDICKALRKRNWYENPDKNSPCFDLKWTLSYKEIDFGALEENQVCNHFSKSGAITTKSGLSNNLKNLVWFSNVDIDTFYPRCFDCSDPSEKEDFITEFKAINAESILKRFLDGEEVTEAKLKVALRICKRRLKDIDELIDEGKLDTWELVKKKEWEVLSEGCITEEQLRLKKFDERLEKVDKKKKKPKKKKKNPNQVPKQEVKSQEDHNMFEEVKQVFEQLKERFPQFSLNGKSNIWIIKPAGLSRGRGITCFNTLVEIMDLLQKEGKWVIQKYIENPLLVLKKKFDIRQWVLVGGWNPLTVWFYERCYLRFGVEDYEVGNLQNKFVHLTNNSVVKNSEQFYTTEIEGSMWHSEEFAELLREKEGRDVWEETIKPKMKQIVKWSLECVQDLVHHRDNSYELYGYDFMIDENYNPWLIEVNSSPALDYSTSVTKTLVKEVLEDTVKVMVDYHYSSDKKKKHVDIGNYSLLHRAKRVVDRPIQSMGLSLVCEGKAIRK